MAASQASPAREDGVLRGAHGCWRTVASKWPRAQNRTHAGGGLATLDAGSALRKLQAHVVSPEAFSSFILTMNYARKPLTFLLSSLTIGRWWHLVELQKLSQDGVDFEPKQIMCLCIVRGGVLWLF